MRIAVLVALAFSFSFTFVRLTAQTDTEIKKVPIQYTDPTSGKEMFMSYCAVCHGVDGKGNGAAVTALKTPPPDLTLLSKSHGGKFPTMHVMSIIRGDTAMPPAHRSKDMPMWGPPFSSLGDSASSERVSVHQRIMNLTEYIKSLQAK
jgi:mono/diheme cytochrome c family protein